MKLSPITVYGGFLDSGILQNMGFNTKSVEFWRIWGSPLGWTPPSSAPGSVGQGELWRSGVGREGSPGHLEGAADEVGIFLETLMDKGLYHMGMGQYL